MKKVFKSKTLYLFLLVVINTIVLIVLCITTYSGTEVGTNYIQSETTVVEPTTSSRYLVGSKDFTVYDNYDAFITDYDNMYSTYIVDNTDIEIGSEIEESDLLGEYEETEVFSSYDALCIDVVDNETSTEIHTYNYNSFLVTVNLNASEYRRTNFESLYDIYIVADGNYYIAKFDGYDYESFTTDSIVKAKFVTTNCDSLVNHNSFCTIEVVQKTYTDQICVAASIYDSQLFSKQFYVIDNGSLVSVYVDSFAIVDDYALITCFSYSLSQGMYLYAL